MRQAQITAMAVTSDAHYVYLGCTFGWTFQRDLLSPRELGRERTQPRLCPVYRILLRQDDLSWVACGRSDTVFVAMGEARAMLRAKMEEVCDIALLPDGRTLLAGGSPVPSDPDAAALAVWDLEGRKCIRQIKLPTRQVTALASSSVEFRGRR